MILRRFTKHVTDQNWFAVGLDVIVVITGIFLGMQVTEWNEDRKRLENDQSFLNELGNDLRVISKSLAKAETEHRRHKDNGIAALSVLNGKPVTDYNRQKVNDGILVIHQLPFPRTKLGNFGMLMDKQISVPFVSEGERKRLISFLDNMSYRLQIYDHIKLSVDGSLNVLRTKVARAIDGETSIPQILDIEALRNDTEFVVSLQNVVSRHQAAVAQINFMIDQIDKYLEGLP